MCQHGPSRFLLAEPFYMTRNTQKHPTLLSSTWHSMTANDCAVLAQDQNNVQTSSLSLFSYSDLAALARTGSAWVYKALRHFLDAPCK